MDVEMVFNELSILKPAENLHIAKEWMSKFIEETTRTATNYGVKVILKSKNDCFKDILLANNYPLPKWRNDKSVNREEQAWIKLLLTKYPTKIVCEEKVVETYNPPSCGLYYAALQQAIAVSLPSALLWNISQILLQHQSNADETLLVHHASSRQHIEANAEWIRERLRVKNPWLKHNLPQKGEYPYRPPKSYYLHDLEDFPTRKISGNEKGFLDDKDQIWLWDKQEQHWDVQYQPYGTDNYFRVSPDGRLLD